MEEEAEVEDELLPAMADDDYSAQLSWQSQSKDNLKCVLFPLDMYMLHLFFQGPHGQFYPGAVRALRSISPSCPPEASCSKGMTHLFRLPCARRPWRKLNVPRSNSASWQVIQQSLSQQVSMPVAQIVAGFTKVFVGEIVEKGDFPPFL